MVCVHLLDCLLPCLCVFAENPDAALGGTSFLVNCFRKTSSGLVIFATFLTSPVMILESSIYLTSWINGNVSFFVVQNLWKFWTLGSALVISLVVGKIALEAGIWGVWRNKKRKLISLNIQISLQARGSGMLEGVRGVWHCLSVLKIQ